MQKLLFIVFIGLIFLGCKEAKETETTVDQLENTTDFSISYAEGFQIDDRGSYKILTVSNPWPGADKSYRYVLMNKGEEVQISEENDGIITVPIQSIVVTSTTHIPSLELLEETNSLVGFPNLNYISSAATRARIDQGAIAELGINEDLNTEVLIDLKPDALVTFAVEGGNQTVTNIQQVGIPVLYNSDWTENHPLGKAEWIKFFGLLFDKFEEASEVFSAIETDYLAAKTLASNTTTSPTVLSGAMYRDIWYLPQGDSWAAQFIKDAGGNYLWQDSKGSGSLSLNIESVLEKGQQADFWIGPGQFSSYNQLAEANAAYEQFKAFQEQTVFTFTAKKGATGGVIYYELAPNRPDLVLKDMIKILHPELLEDYELYFFSRLEP